MKRLFGMILTVAVLGSGLPALGRPYRVVNARTPRSTGAGNFEIGLRYQGLFEGEGFGFEPRSFQQIAATLRIGILDRLELDTEASAIVFHDLDAPGDVKVEPGDVRLALQLRVLEAGPSLLGLFAGLTFPTGPSDIDVLPPFFADGTWDFEGLLLYELAPPGPVRLIFNFGYLHQGTRDRGPRPDFDVPDALRYDAAFAIHLGWRVLASLELNGRYHFEDAISPVWTHNRHILELTPGLRIEITPRFVLEAGAGIALNDDTRAIYKFRAIAGLTYEFPVF